MVSSVASSLAESGKFSLLMRIRVNLFWQGVSRVQGELKGLSHFLSGRAKVDVGAKTRARRSDGYFAGIILPNPAELLGRSDL